MRWNGCTWRRSIGVEHDRACEGDGSQECWDDDKTNLSHEMEHRSDAATWSTTPTRDASHVMFILGTRVAKERATWLNLGPANRQPLFLHYHLSLLSSLFPHTRPHLFNHYHYVCHLHSQRLSRRHPHPAHAQPCTSRPRCCPPGPSRQHQQRPVQPNPRHGRKGIAREKVRKVTVRTFLTTPCF